MLRRIQDLGMESIDGMALCVLHIQDPWQWQWQGSGVGLSISHGVES